MNPFNLTDYFKPGAIKDRIDPRDYHWPTEIGAALPPFDWSQGIDVQADLSTSLKNQSFTLPVKSQNGSLSCGGQAWASYGSVLEAFATVSFEERSAKFIYAQTHVVGGGSAGRDNCNLVVKQGWATEATCVSYDHGAPPGEDFMERASDITDASRADASKSTAVSYANTGTNIDDIAQAIRENHGVVIGVSGQNNGTWGGEFPQPPIYGSIKPIWRHWVYAAKAKLVNGVKHIGFLNSWGTGFGDKGWQWLSETYFNTILSNETAIWSGWTHIYNLNPVSTAFHYMFNTNMSFGDANDDVKALQKALTLTGDFPVSISPTGYYGNATSAAVLKFQIRSGILQPDRNHAGPLTRAALNARFSQ